MNTTLLIGLTGMSLILVGFLLNLFKHIQVNSKTYLVLNLLGSIAMMWYALLVNSIPFFILNIVWTGAAAWRLIRGVQ
jgi:hypothetical protein